jgi:DNA invertase Pin-like site-specific DNA recombinase
MAPHHASGMAGIAEFERDQIRERVKSGLAAAQWAQR